MLNLKQYTDYSVEQAVRLLAVDSPTGYTSDAEQWLLQTFRDLGYAPVHTVKGGVLVDLGGEEADNGLLLEAHCDTLGGMVAEVKGSGRLRLTRLGGLPAVMANTENVRVVTKFDGTLQRLHPRQRGAEQDRPRLRQHRGGAGRVGKLRRRREEAGHRRGGHRLL